MYIRKQKILALAVGLMTTASAYAQSRGGSCRGPICNAVGFGVFLLISGIFSFSIYDNVKRNGFVKGLFGHPGVQVILVFASMTAIIVGVPAVMMYFLGKGAAMGSLIFMMAALVWYVRRAQSRPPVHSDTEVERFTQADAASIAGLNSGAKTERE